MTYYVWDIETTTKETFKRKANPFDPDNWVVASGSKPKGTSVDGLYATKRGGLPADWFTRMLRAKLLVGFNIKFDLLHALQEPANLEAWMDWAAAGGQVWDCQLAEYLLDGQKQASHMLSLDEVAVRYGGNLKIDEVKHLWAAGVDTPDIPRDLLMRYLCGDPPGTDGRELGDIENTEVVFLGQLEKARERGQLRSIMLNMGALLCTVEMERNGMAVNVPLGLEIAADLKQQLTSYVQQLNDSLPKDLPFEFNWNSRVQLSALIFGGAVKYEKPVPILDESGALCYKQKDVLAYLLEDGGLLTEDELSDMDRSVLPFSRYKTGANKGEIKTKRIKVPDKEAGPKMRKESFLYHFPGVTAPDKAWESSTPGVYSVASDVMDQLAGRDVPFLQLLGKLNKVKKDLTTYYITEDDNGKRKGMLTLVQPDGIIHHKLNMTNTVTGRLSSSDPNLQNLSKGTKSRVKELFESRFPGGVIGQSDFSSLEIYVQAILTGSKALIDDLLANIDMHCMRLAIKEGMPYEEVLRLAKVEALPEWDAKRTKAKVFSFQRAYGAGAKLIAAETGMSVEEVEALIAAEEARYPEIKAYFDDLLAKVQERRRPTNLFVPGTIPGTTAQLGVSWSVTPDGKRYSYMESPSPEYLARRGQLASFSPTEVKDYEVQGTGGEFTKAAMWLLIREFYRHKNFGGKALLVNQVHDANYIDAHPEVAPQALAVLHACMEAASDLMAWYFNWPIPLPVPSDTSSGPSMAVENKVGADVLALAKQHREFLRTEYMQGFNPQYQQPKENQQ